MVFPIINDIKAISTHFRCPEPSMNPTWTEFRAEILEKEKIENIDPNKAF